MHRTALLVFALLPLLANCTGQAAKKAPEKAESGQADACPAGKKPGDEWQSGECNTCKCSPNGKRVCTRRSCVDNDDPLD